MTTRQLWSVYCNGSHEGVPCGSWIGHQPTEEEARSMATLHKWFVEPGGKGPDYCPRCKRERNIR